MSELDKLIENYFAPRPNTLTKQMLYEMFDEVLEEDQFDTFTGEKKIDKDLSEELYMSIVTLARQQDLFDKKKNLTLSKKKQLRRMSAISKNLYSAELADVYKYFSGSGTYGTTIEKPNNLTELVEQLRVQLGEEIEQKSWKSLLDSVENPLLALVETPAEAYWTTYVLSTKTNDGEKREQGIVAYCNKIQPHDDTRAVSRAGEDFYLEGTLIELKSSEKSDPNYQLNSSAIVSDPEKAYMFMVDSKTTPTVFIIASELFYNVATFRLVQDQGDDSLEKSIRKNVKEILGEISLTDIITQTALTGKPYDVETKSFTVGKSPITARFRIMFSLGKIEE